MSETVTKKKKKNLYDYEAVATKLNGMIEDLERTEKDTVLEIWKEYQKAPEPTNLLKNLNKSDVWCYQKFREYNLALRQQKKSDAIKEAHAEKKVEQLVTIVDKDEQPEFVEELTSQPAVKIVGSDDFRIYETCMNKMSKVYTLTSDNFDVSHNYKMKLIDELKRAIKHLNDVLEDVEGEYESS